MWKKLFLSLTCNVFLLILPNDYSLADRLKNIPLSDAVALELAYVLTYVGSQKQQPDFEPERVANLLDFVAKPKAASELHYADNLFEMPSAYLDITVNRSLANILRYAYNPEIPYCTIAPSTVRICELKETDQGRPSWPRLWEMLSDLNKPITIKGVEYVVNTPDLNSGAYYAYDQDRALILFRYHGKRVMVSLAKQRGKSEVGKKGLVLGTDEDWDYVYTGEPGLAKSGLGWVRSYMYDSIGVAVYFETQVQKPMVRLGLFRWVRAGWANINMVKREHIYSGMQRFAKSFQKIIEYPLLPEENELANIYSQIEHIPVEDLRKYIKNYLKILKKRYKNTKEFPKKWRKLVFEGTDYWGRLTKEEMKSILFVERLKEVLLQH
jgi:hypothetical protein